MDSSWPRGLGLREPTLDEWLEDVRCGLGWDEAMEVERRAGGSTLRAALVLHDEDMLSTARGFVRQRERLVEALRELAAGRYKRRAVESEGDALGFELWEACAVGDWRKAADVMARCGNDNAVINWNDRGYFRRTPFAVAARWGHQRVLHMLAEAGADVNQDGWGWGPAHWAVYCGRAEIFRVLHKLGVHIDMQNDRRYTPLHLASRTGNVDMLRELARLGADMHAVTNSDLTALHLATEPHIARALVDAGAHVDACGENMDDTAMHFAVSAGNTGMVRMLWALGADLNATNADDYTIIRCAVMRAKRAELVWWLVEHGTRTDVKSRGDLLLERVQQRLLERPSHGSLLRACDTWRCVYDDRSHTCVHEASMHSAAMFARQRNTAQAMLTAGLEARIVFKTTC